MESCPSTDGHLVVSFLNVGQGDATLISCPDGVTQALIDAGESQAKYPNAETMLLGALKKRMGEDKILEFAFATHPHQDHIYGFHSTLPNAGYSILSYFDNGADNTSSTVEEEIRDRLRTSATNYHNLSTESLESVLLCKHSGIRLKILRHTVKQDKALGCPEQLNNCSLITRLEHLGVSFLFMADSLEAREKLLLRNPAQRKYFANTQVLTAGHHASGSTSRELLLGSAPALVVLSTGQPGKGSTGIYDFPQTHILERIGQWFKTSPHVLRNNLGEILRRNVSGCHRREGACRWAPSELPWNAWSTATSGSLDILVQENFMCVSGDLRTNSIEFSF